MPWPLSQDYNEAMQNPTISFSDSELRQGQAKTNTLGLPVPCSGNFSDVYQVRKAARAWAVKCFTREMPGLRERYAEISAYLPRVRLPFMVAFKYLDQGIQVRGQWYPVLKMDWVEGFALNQFIKENLDEPRALQKLAQLWIRLARLLREANVAHGDLQHGNVLLVPLGKAGASAIKLVDYDGMCVPALARLKSIEVGHPAYQHPQRLQEAVYGLEADRFSHLVIYTALRALMVGGRALWEKYDNGDNLLFKETDFEAPARSPLFAELLRMNHPEVHDLAVSLVDAARMPLDRTPLLEELVWNSRGSPSIMAGKPKGEATTAPAVTAESSTWVSALPPVRLPVPQATATPLEPAERVFAQATDARSDVGVWEGLDVPNLRPTKGRSMLIGALMTTAAIFLSCLALGTLIFRGPADKRATSSPMAKGKTQPETADKIRPITKSGGDTRPCGGCERGAPFDGPYDVTRQCRICWLFHNDAAYRKLWGGGDSGQGTVKQVAPAGIVKQPKQEAKPGTKTIPSGQNVQYLSDMQEFDVKVAEGRFAKKGNLGYGEGDRRYGYGKITLNGKGSPNGLSMCPASNTYAGVKYRLEGAAHTFLASVALNDSAGAAGRPPGVGRIPTPLTFQVLGDSKLLWKSKPVDIARIVQECKVGVTGVHVLELRVACPGSGVNAQAVWLEPRVLK